MYPDFVLWFCSRGRLVGRLGLSEKNFLGKTCKKCTRNIKKNPLISKQ